MAFLRIRCGRCKQRWEVYDRSFNDENGNVCPHCGARVDEQTWKYQVIPALCQTADANRELTKDYLGSEKRKTLFSFDVIEDHHYTNKHFKD